ncbi:lysophospholipid acyltransferase family protein [Candidatus Nitrosacidococcus tergens]|uniref:Phospholipid/glycerol acyltransferase n=1 Tax=Candidatus Nitrosacidococcus tergens TaxID=553981 RepID=A0A7G1Q7X5_9GAMM|nr:lysophospholipid acyltransferase family protein [Candidatus Nitrosacidococcus tergens]CAB1274734.1 Phospholipid/glycerol acyltransferase [Candidatus Nitrosacidococcus tergens]
MAGIWWLFLGLLIAWRIVLGFQACKRANRADWGSTLLNYLDGLNRIYCYKFHRLNSKLLPLPETGGALIVANHISGLDPQLLIAVNSRPLRFLIAREEYERRGFQWLFKGMRCIPVDRETKPEKALKAALLALQAGEVIALFPQGKIHLPSDPPTSLKKGAIWLATHTQAPIYPVHIKGVKGQGQVMGALFQRSHVTLHHYNPIFSQSLLTEACLAQISQAIQGNKA